MRETWIQSLGRQDPLEKEMATHSSILAWRIPSSLVGYRLWGLKESDTTEWLHFHYSFIYIYISGLNGIFSPPSIHIRKLELIQYLPTFFPFSFHNMTNSLLLFVGCIISKFYFLSEHSISCTICCFQNIHRKQCDPERWKINKLGKSIILPVVLVLSLLSDVTLAMVDSFIYWLVKVVPWVVSSRSAKSHISVCLQVFLLLLHLGHGLLG